MSSSSSDKQPAPASEEEASTKDDIIESLNNHLVNKDLEIVSLKKEIAALKKQLQQEKEKKQSVVEASVEGIANDSLSSASGKQKSTKVEARWKNRFQQLVAYKLEHGDCNVSKSYHEKSLHSWVRTQRENKKAFDANKPGSTMTQERIDALNSIGFQWVVGHQPKDDQWDGMFQQLMQYKQRKGHTRVTQTENKQLYKWVLNQRARRRLLESKGEGKAKGMTWARVEKLSAIDFCWEATSRTRTATSAVSAAGLVAGQTEQAAEQQQAAVVVQHYGAVAAAAPWARPPDAANVVAPVAAAAPPVAPVPAAPVAPVPAVAPASPTKQYRYAQDV